jgi:acyl carrier protein
MTKNEVAEQVAEVLSVVLGRAIAPNDEVKLATEERWDSLKHMELVFALEETFCVRFDETEMVALDSSSAIVDAVTRRNAA